MDDLIDRQAAIDAIEFGITYAKAINKETGEVKELFQASNDELRKAEDRIKQLPSAQPEITVEQVKEYCEEMGFVVLTSDEYHWLKSLKSKAEEYRWNGGGNY